MIRSRSLVAAERNTASTCPRSVCVKAWACVSFLMGGGGIERDAYNRVKKRDSKSEGDT